MLLRSDPVQAFLDYPAVPVASAKTGPLAGLTLAVKDLFDVIGYRTGGGHPRKRAESDAKSASAPVVQRLLDAGARFVGKTHTDEFAYSMNGENPHYGTPINVRAPGRIPGGSSSGSAAATAAGLVDFALATDTGGSVRMPASYCGLIGLRPTHGRIDTTGLQPLAESFDTVGWFARDMDVFERVGDVLLPADNPGPPLSRMIVAEDILAQVVDERAAAVFRASLARIEEAFQPAGPVRIAPEGLTVWRLTFRTLQAYEAWAAHGAWIKSRRPLLGSGVRERFEWASGVSLEDYCAAMERRTGIRARVRSLVEDDTVMVVPTVPAVAPPLAMEGDELEAYRNRAVSMLCSAGLSGLPQISLPIGEHEGYPFGISLIASAGRDRALIKLAGEILAACI